jgi:hypothetical protein
MNAQGDIRVFLDFTAFAAGEIRVENETSLIDAFEQYDASGGATIGGYGGEGHRGGIARFVGECAGKIFFECEDGIVDRVVHRGAA